MPTVNRTVRFGPQPRFPTHVSASKRHLLDQYRDPWFGVGDTAWELPLQLTTTEITQYLEDRAAKSVNLVLVEAPGHFFSNQTPKYRNVNGDDPFTGTAFASTLTNAYWNVVDHACTEGVRLGVTLMICPAYLGFSGTDEGWNDEIVAASDANMDSYGDALATRYGDFPNIIWLIGHDRTPSATEKTREAALTDALRAGTSHLVTVGGPPGGLGSTAWAGTVTPDLDTIYDNGDGVDYANLTRNGWDALPTKPTGYLEPRYEGEGTGTFENAYNDEPHLRAAMYNPLCAGVTYTIFGNNPMWHFEASNALFAYSNIGSWEAALDSPGSLKLQVFGEFIASLDGRWASCVPDTTDTFLTAGEGSGANRVAACFDAVNTAGVLAMAYRPNGGASTLTFDLTELDQVANVRIRKMDPFDGAYTTIGTFATSGSQNVGSLGTNGAGDADWMIVMDAA